MGKSLDGQARPATPLLVGIFLVLAAVVAVLFFIFRGGANGTSVTQTDSAVYVETQRCAECHTEQYDQWLGSHHEQAMKVASAETVLGDFNDAVFTDGPVTSRFFQKEGSFYIHTEGADGVYADFPVRYTFGFDPLQQYLLALPNGRLQAFTVAWDVEQKRWFSLYPDTQAEIANPYHWTALGNTANSSCIECHTTNMTLNYDLATDSYNTTWDEVNVSCQACHGPGSEHIRWVERGAKESQPDRGLLVDFGAASPQSQTEACAPCHSLRYAVSPNDTAGHAFYDDFMPELLHPGYYHADGQMLGEVYNFGSFLQSKMYHAGVTCTTCHNPHSGQLRTEGNQLCAGCHQPNPPVQQYPGLQAKAYDSPEHHFHPGEGPGSRCVDCHMPPQTYMVIDPRHDHQFSIPRPDNTVRWGTPNACANCHGDVADTEIEVAQWAVATMDEWYGPQWQERPSLAGIFSVARQADRMAEIPLQQVIDDPAQPAIIRATAIDLAGQFGNRGMALLPQSLGDTSPIVRAAALRGLTGLPDEQKVVVLGSFLEDPVRGVRVEAARALASAPRTLFRPEQAERFEAAIAEYKAAQLALADRPEGHINLGNLYAVMGIMDEAENAFSTAIGRDRSFLAAYTNLANFYYQTGRRTEAEATFREGLLLVDEPGTLYYSLGLLLAEEERLGEAIESMHEAAQQMPYQPRVHYNHGLLLQKAGNISGAEAALIRATELAPEDSTILWALISLYVEQEAWDAALPRIKRLTELLPASLEAQNLFRSVQEYTQGE